MVLRYILFQYTLGIFLGFTSVNREWFPESNGVLELTNEYFLLSFPRRVVVVIVKTYLAPSNAARMSHRL